MPTRLERLDGALADAAAAVRRSGGRLRKARADRVSRALAASTPAERLAALDDPILTRADRRMVREHVGVPLAPETNSASLGGRRGPSRRLLVLLSRWRPNPFSLAMIILVGGSIVTGLGLAWFHTGRGARMSGLCRDLVFMQANGTTRKLSLTRGEWVTVRWRSNEAATIAVWVPLSGYATALVAQRCLAADR